MRDTPSAALVDTLERLGLASSRTVARHGGAARRLARGLPLFESVWLDAMVRSRRITSLQAERIAAGQGDSLRVGPYVLREKVATLGYADVYDALDPGTRQPVRLAVRELESSAEDISEAAMERLRRLVALRETASDAPLDLWIGVGREPGRFWAASSPLDGVSADQWLVNYGRMQPDAVLGIARRMARGLALLEENGFCHGDIAARNLALGRGGKIRLAYPGLREVLRPQEGIASADLAPAFYDYLAPERIARGERPNLKSDMFACGCLWWELLTGRPPFPGGDALHKMRAILENTALRLGGDRAAAGISAIDEASSYGFDVRRIVPAAPAPLASALATCMAADPQDRFDDMRSLARSLGAPARGRRRRIGRERADTFWQRQTVWPAEPRRRPLRAARRSPAGRVPAGPWTMLMIGLVLGVIVAAAWSSRNGERPEQVASPSAPRNADNAANDAYPATGSSARLPVGRNTFADDADRPTETSPPGRSGEAAGARIELPDDRPIDATRLAIAAPGTIVGGTPRARGTVVVSQGPLVVPVSGVCIEHVDFVWFAAEEGDATRPAPPEAMVRVTAADVTFRGCTFRAVGQGAAPASAERPSPAAIAWSYPPVSSAIELPSGRLALTDCTIAETRRALVLDTRGVIAVTLDNVLVTGGGRILDISRTLSAEDSLHASLQGVTFRGRDGAIVYRCAEEVKTPGRLSIRADRSVFQTATGSPLLQFESDRPTEAVTAAFSWTGEDSVIGLDTSVAAWRDASGGFRPIDDFQLAIAGLVRGQITFAGPGPEPEASRVVRWQAPLHRDAAPGVDISRLP